MAIKDASMRSGAATLATVRGAMTAGGRDEVVVTGAVDFKDRRSELTLAPSPGVATYPPYEARYVSDWSYVEIDAAVRRPPTVRAGTSWIAFQQKPAYLPVPDRSLPPEFPIDVVGLPLTQPVINARFLDTEGSNPRRISVQLGGKYTGTDLVYAIDRGGRIASVSYSIPADGQGSRFTFTYESGVAEVAVPSGSIQRLTPGEDLYPTTTTAPSA